MPERYYLAIDELSLYNWEKCIEGDLRFVTRNGVSTEFDAIVWANLYNEYLGRFGISTDFDKYLETSILLTELRCLFVQTGDDSLLNQIAIEEINLNQQDPSKHEGMTTSECLVHLSKWLGVHLKAKELTIVEFKNYMNEYVRVNKEK